MGLFSTSRAGVPLMNAYQFQTHASLPDLSLFANMGVQRGRSSAASRASSPRSSDGAKEGLIGALAEYESENVDIQQTENSIINSAYQQFIEEGGNDLYEFFDNHSQAIGQQLAEVQARKRRLRVLEPQLKRDSERYDKLSEDSDFLNVASLRMGPGNVFEAYGVRSDGTIGWGRAENMIDVYTNQRAMPYINAQSSMYGVEFPTKYDQAAGRNQLQTLLNSKQPNMIREGSDYQSFSQNFNALKGYLNNAVGSLSPEEQMSIMNEALMRSEYMPIPDSEGNEVGKQFLMPVYEYGFSNVVNGKETKETRLVAKPVLDENGNQLYIDPLADPRQAIQTMGIEIAATLAAGTEKIIYETRNPRIGMGGGRSNDRQRGYFFGVVNHQVYGDQIPFGFDQDYIDVAKSLQDSGLMINQSALRTLLNNKTRIWLNTGTNREDLNSTDRTIRYRKVKELADLMESAVQNPSAFMPDVGGANRAGVQAFFSATGNGLLGIFAKAGMSAAEGVSSSPFSFGEIAANVIMGQPVTRTPMPHDVIDHLQQYRGAKLHNSSMIRIAGSDVKLAGDIVGNNSLPFEVGELAYSPAQFSSTANIAGNIEGFEELPSVLGYTYLRANELKNINMNTKTRKRSLHRYRDDLNVVRGSSIDISTQRGKLLKESIMQAYGLTEAEFQKGEFYRVPMVVPIRDWNEVDNFYKDKMRPINQVFEGEEAAYVARQLYDGLNRLQRTGESIVE